MTSGSAARRRRAAQARRAEQSRSTGVSIGADRYKRRVLTWVVDPDPLLALLDADRLRRHLETEAMPQICAAARSVGYTWADIGEALGLTRQAAHSRWGTSGDSGN